MLKRICTICARGGSKGVPGKNIRPLMGLPLIGHTLRVARQSGLFSTIAVSSDSTEIIETARSLGADHLVLRPSNLASDTASKLGAIVHCVEAAERDLGQKFDIVVDLDVTSPLRSVEDVAGAVAMLESSQGPNVITGCTARRSPYFNLVEEAPNGTVRLAKVPTQPILRRQDAPKCYDMNASIYVWRRNQLMAKPAVFYPDTRLFEMPDARSHDIDSELDFRWVEFLMKGGGV